MTVLASWPIMTLPTASMWVAPVRLGVDAGADGDELDEPFLRADAALADGERVAARFRLADRGDGAGDDLVEHLGHDAQRLVAGELDEALVEAGVGAARTPRGRR